MYQAIVLLVGKLATLAANANVAVINWATQQLEGSVSKESEARAALDEAIDRMEAWQAADDENDAAELQKRVQRINDLTPTPAGQSHLPTDALTGQPVDPGTTVNDLGPAAPQTSAPETSQPEDNAPVQESESRSSDNV